MEPAPASGRPGDSATLAQLRRGALPHCVLAVLAEEERYAFEIVETLSALPGLTTTTGTIYPLLSRLRRDGLVDTTWRESTTGPPRRYYQLTPMGERTLTAFREDWRSFRAAVDHLLEGGRS